jgi:hypothetical protein
MQATFSHFRSSRAAALGLVLIALGILAVALRELRLDVFGAIAEAGWPLFVIIPGLALLGVAIVVGPPSRLGFAIAGSIVTSVGALLWYQDLTGHWESWAYAWALIGPGAAGVALAVYGGIHRSRDTFAQGVRLAGIAAVIFGAGFWFFETLFETGRTPVDVGAWSPAILIIVGLAVLASGALQRGVDDARRNVR